MELKRTRLYPVSPETLVQVLTSRDYFEARHAWSGITNHRFEAFGESGEGFLIRICRPLEIKTDKLPGFAARLVPRSADLITELLWTRLESPPFQGRYRFELSGVPVEVRGSMTVTAQQAGEACQEVALRIDSRVPLIGSRIARLVAGGVDRALESDYQGTLRYIETLSPGQGGRAPGLESD